MTYFSDGYKLTDDGGTFPSEYALYQTYVETDGRMRVDVGWTSTIASYVGTEQGLDTNSYSTYPYEPWIPVSSGWGMKLCIDSYTSNWLNQFSSVNMTTAQIYPDSDVELSWCRIWKDKIIGSYALKDDASRTDTTVAYDWTATPWVRFTFPDLVPTIEVSADDATWTQVWQSPVALPLDEVVFGLGVSAQTFGKAANPGVVGPTSESVWLSQFEIGLLTEAPSNYKVLTSTGWVFADYEVNLSGGWTPATRSLY